MPTYEFECHQCGFHQDRVLPITQAPATGEATKCGMCGGDSLVRIPSVPTIADAALRTSISGYPYVSRRHALDDVPGLRRDRLGHPIINSPKHEREVMARTGLVRE